MAYTVSLSSSELKIVQEKRRKLKDSKLLRRYQCLYMLHEQFSKKEIAQVLGVNIDTVTDWAKIYLNSGLNSIEELNYEGRRPSSLDAIKSEIINYVKSENISTISQLQDILKKEHNTEVEHSWLFRYCKKNSISLIRKQD